MQALEPRRLLASVALFDDASYVDTAGTFESEADNVRAALSSLGHTVSPFTGITAADFTSALAGKDVLLIPEQEINHLTPDLTEDAQAVIRDYVAGGGGLIVHGFGGFGGLAASELLNAIFDYSLVEQSFGPFTSRTFESQVTQFISAPTTLPANNGTSSLLLSSLPDDAFPMYGDGFSSTVTIFRHGLGEIIFLGWDWYFSNPPNAGGQTGGWQQVLGAAVSELVTDPNPNAPRARAGGPYAGDEGTDTLQVTLDASASTDPNQPASTLIYAWDLDYDAVFGETGAGATRGDEVGPNPTFRVTGLGELDGPRFFRALVRVTDAQGLSSYSSANIRVLNVSPTAAIAGPSSAAAGAAVEFTFSATDPSTADTNNGFSYEVDWGDGGVEYHYGPASGITVSHMYALSGERTIRVRATDKDGGTGEAASHVLNISAAALGPDPIKPEVSVLYVSGTEGDDVIRLSRKTRKSPLVVTINGAVAGSFYFTGSISINSGPGHDDILIGGEIAQPTEIDTGEGDDTARGGGGADVILGREGNDHLEGGAGRDLLIGGVGTDYLYGADGEDLLIAGYTDYEWDLYGRRLIMAEWTRTDQNYLRRVDHLRFGGGFNDGYILYAYDDGEADVLTGGRSDDWFFSHGSPVFGVVDIISDLRPDEYSTET